MVDEDGPVNRRTTEGHAITLFLVSTSLYFQMLTLTVCTVDCLMRRAGPLLNKFMTHSIHFRTLICLQDISIAHTHFHPPLINCFLCNNCNSFPARPSPSPKGEGDFASFLDSMTASHHVAVAKDVLHMYLTYTSPVICS